MYSWIPYIVNIYPSVANEGTHYAILTINLTTYIITPGQSFEHLMNPSPSKLYILQMWIENKERKRRGKWLRARDAFQSCFQCRKNGQRETGTEKTAGLCVGY